MSTNDVKAVVTRYRWVVCALLFFATTINYIDRQILSLIKEILDEELKWTNAQFGMVNSAFQGAYAVGLLFFGWFVDRYGTKMGYAVSIVAWSLAAIGHSLVGSVTGFFTARVSLGVSEGGNFPSAIKAVALWFPKRERAFATSIFNAGTNVGAIVAPAMIPAIALTMGWKWAFILAGIAGLLWLFFWLPMYGVPEERRANVSDAELELIRSDKDEKDDGGKVGWLSVLGYRQSWSFIVGKFMTDPVWWFFLIWLPDFFNKTLLLNIKKSWVHLVTIYTIITVLSIIGGWVPGYFIKRGWTVTRARKAGMFVFALCVLPVMFATNFGQFNVDAGFFDRLKTAQYTVVQEEMKDGKAVKTKVQQPVPAEVGAAMQQLSGKSYTAAEDYIKAAGTVLTPETAERMKQPLADCARNNALFWIAVLLIGLAGAAHQAWSANLYTTVSDMFPKKAIASLTGIGGMAGSIGGILFPTLTGWMIDVYQKQGQVTKGYAILFTICAFAYVVAFAIHHLLAPKFDQVRMVGVAPAAPQAR